MSDLKTKMPPRSVCMDAAATGAPIKLDGLDVVVHEVVPLMPAELKPDLGQRHGNHRQKPPARA